MNRRSGVLTHITSLPSDFGVGDLGPGAFRFADILSESRQSYWEILPVTPTGPGNSPYNSFSVFAGNPTLISPEILTREGLLSEVPALASGHTDSNRVNYDEAIAQKKKMLLKAFERFKSKSHDKEFEEFCSVNSDWLEDHALYIALKEERSEQWYTWPKPLRERDPHTMEAPSAHDFPMRKTDGCIRSGRLILKMASSRSWPSMVLLSSRVARFRHAFLCMVRQTSRWRAIKTQKVPASGEYLR